MRIDINGGLIEDETKNSTNNKLRQDRQPMSLIPCLQLNSLLGVRGSWVVVWSTSFSKIIALECYAIFARKIA